MARVPLSDEDCDRLVASRDPIDYSVLYREPVAQTRRRLHDVLLADLHGAVWPRPALSRRRRRRGFGIRRRRLAVLGAIAIALPAGVLTVGALLPTGGIHDGQLDVTPASAAVVLDRAANAAMRRAPVVPGPGKYGFLKVETGSVVGTGGTSGHVDWNIWTWHSELKADWYRADGSGRERIVQTGRRFLTPLDRSVARAHGTTLAQLLEPFAPNIDGAFPAGALETAGFLPYWRTVFSGELPTEPAALRRAFERLLGSFGPSGSAPWRADPASLFGPISDFLFLPISSSLRAALFRLLAHLPGVQLLGWKHDRLGRRGLAVAVVRGAKSLLTREELLFDPATSEVLQTQVVQLRSMHMPNTSPMPAGTVLEYTVFISRGVVNSITELPGGGHVPLHPPSSAGAKR